MKHVFLIFVCLYFGLASSSIAASLREDILKVIQKNGLNKDQVGAEIQLGNQKTFSLNAEKKYIPASITKVVTAYAVLKNFPLNFKFKTELFWDGKNLYIKGGGDPSFVSENMWYLVNEFVRMNIKSVQDIIVDDSLFDQVRYDQTRESVRVDRSYDAPVGAMSFNWNSINIYVKPGESGQSAVVYLDPESSYFKLINKTKTTSKKADKELIIDVNQDQRVITVSGEVHTSLAEKAYFKNVADPAFWTGENLKSFMHQRGIQTTGKIKSGIVPASASKVATSESKNINQILIDMNKFSNNFVAEMLTKNLAVLQGEKPARLATGIEVIRNELKKLDAANEHFYIENPSGFSRDNRMSARGLNRVLQSLQNDFQIFPGFIESLPILGIDGTLKKRMKNSPIQGFVRAKTGYLDGVITLSGYAGKASGEVYSFTFLYNGPRDMPRVHETFDQMLLTLLK